MVRRFSIKPTLTIRGRTFKGLRGFAGKPSHPPLTDIPVAAYMLAAVFDVISFVAGAGSPRGREFFLTASYVLISGAFVSLFTALTGFWDWFRSTEPGTQARRTANWHMAVMLAVTSVVMADIVVRVIQWHHASTSSVVLGLSVVAGLLVAFGATYGGALVFEYGFNVETAGDHPAWHRSETDVFPSEH